MKFYISILFLVGVSLTFAAPSDKRYFEWLQELKKGVQTGEPAKIIPILENGVKLMKNAPVQTDYSEMVRFIVGNFVKELSNSPKDGLKKVRIFVDDRLKKRDQFIANMG